MSEFSPTTNNIPAIILGTSTGAVSNCIFNRKGCPSEKMAEPGWMGSSILQKIPCAIFGPGEFDAQGVSYVDLAQVVECANTLIDVIETFCS